MCLFVRFGHIFILEAVRAMVRLRQLLADVNGVSCAAVYLLIQFHQAIYVVLLLGAAVLFWTAGFDIIYSCQDTEIDKRDGLFSMPANLGLPLAMWISRTSHSLAVTLLLLLALVADLGIIYVGAVVITAILLIAEHALVRYGKMTYIKTAFATINGIISILLAIAAVCDISVFN